MNQNTDSFKDFLCTVQAKNSLLKDTTSHLDEAKLCHQIEAGLNESLDGCTKLLKVHLITSFKSWTEELKHVDKLITAKHGELQKIMNQNHELSHCGNALADPSCCANTSMTTTVSNTKGDFPPKLTDKEKTLLWDNESCFCCRKFYIDHKSKECTLGFPSGVNYHEWMQADVDAAKTKKSHTDKDRKSKAVAAVIALTSASSSHGSQCYLSDLQHYSNLRRHSASPHYSGLPSHHSVSLCHCFHSSSPYNHSASVSMSPDHGVAAVLGMSCNPTAYPAMNRENIIENDLTKDADYSE